MRDEADQVQLLDAFPPMTSAAPSPCHGIGNPKKRFCRRGLMAVLKGWVWPGADHFVDGRSITMVLTLACDFRLGTLEE